MRFEKKRVTPEMAKVMLENNKNNRKIHQASVDMLAREMKAGNWKITHQGIAIYDNGDIADGQHRLTAIVQSGITCEMLVTYGVPSDNDTILAIDSGRSRNVNDSAKITGLKLSVSDVSVAMALSSGFNKRGIKLTHKEKITLCEKYEKNISAVNYCMAGNIKGVAILPVRVCVAKLSETLPIEFLAEFCKVLRTGIYNDEIMTNAVRLRNNLLCNIYRIGSEHSTAYNITYNAIMATYKGNIIKRLRSDGDHHLNIIQ